MTNSYKWRLIPLFVLIAILTYGYSRVGGIEWNHWTVNTLIEGKQFESLNRESADSSCNEPTSLGVKLVSASSATIFWDNNTVSSWEYIVQAMGSNIPSTIANGVITTQNSNAVAMTSNGVPLSSNTMYEYYVRANCINGDKSDWAGPFMFKTLCTPNITFPFEETFNTTSKSVACWNLIDANNDKEANKTNSWQESTTGSYEGNRCMKFYGTAAVHDDWLISPTFQVTATKLYEVSFYYQSAMGAEFEVVLSQNGIDKSSFTQVVLSSKKYIAKNYTIEKGYVTGINGTINLAWHVQSKGTSELFLDKITIEEVSCKSPNVDVTVSTVTTNSASFSWLDSANTQWEYFVNISNTGLPTGLGTALSNNQVVVSQVNGVGGGNLLANTYYDFYVRSTCGVGKYSKWIGPIRFKTACNIQGIPFYEGFNLNSSTINCWDIYDTNEDKVLFKQTKTPFEGTHSMAYTGSGLSDDWLVSPPIQLDKTKLYLLSYRYRTTLNDQTDFSVLISTKGNKHTDFTKILSNKTSLFNDQWQKESIVLADYDGVINLAWFVGKKNNAALYIDDINVTEISCSQPFKCETISTTNTQATISFEDPKGSKWEYYVQDTGKGNPVGNGKSITTRSFTVNATQNNTTLQPNTAYEYFIRTVCDKGLYGAWSGPYSFRTGCTTVKLPFVEGFNTLSTTINCWTIIDINKDGTATVGKWNRNQTGQSEGSHGMNFRQVDPTLTKDSDDWLISPTFNLDANKVYRLTYDFKTDLFSDYNDFEVLLSTSGLKSTDFKKVIVPKATYKTNKYFRSSVFIANINGAANLGWKVTGKGNKSIYIDNVVVEEVVTCPEPINLVCSATTATSTQIEWSDHFGATQWEYVVQEQGKGVPVGAGIKTANKINTISKDINNNPLKQSTKYEFYVRTVCDGTSNVKSEWSGPSEFVTLCDVFVPTFFEGFNTQSASLDCWTFTKNDTRNFNWSYVTTGQFEGDRVLKYTAIDALKKDSSDIWAISPKIRLTAGSYILKYRYKTDAVNQNEFEVLLSSSGVDISKFTTTLVSKKVYANAQYIEEVVLFQGVASEVNIGWHIVSKGTTNVFIDQVELKKVNGCVEPYAVTATNTVPNGTTLTWKQDGAVTSWEVIAVAYGKDNTATPIVSSIVTGNPTTVITGLAAHSAYTIYVRANCIGNGQKSDWSTPIHIITQVGGIDHCANALMIPVNQSNECLKTVDVALNGATFDQIVPFSTCGGFDPDIWLEFTATQDIHLLKMLDIVSLAGTSITLNGALYDLPCGQISRTSALECFSLGSFAKDKVFKNLTIGKKYYIRLSTNIINSLEATFFKLCISSPAYLDIVASGAKYTTQQLVEEVLIKADCNLVSNINYQVGNGSAETKTVNTLGYFNQSKSSFPFKEGIVLGTGEVQYIQGPYLGEMANRGNNPHRWVGDTDINAAVADAGGGPLEDKRVTQLEFDFKPVKDSIQFEYLFASNSYIKSCLYACNTGALFTAWLVDKTTNEAQNLAKVNHTNLPIGINTIRDAQKSGILCESRNEQYYWKHNIGYTDNPMESVIDFAGYTVPMKSEKIKVIPGRTYHIKLAIMDFCPTPNHTSAVFFNANSFDLGTLKLGVDRLRETNNALCSGEEFVIDSRVTDPTAEIKWFKDGVLLIGEKGSTLKVNTDGTYSVNVKYQNIECDIEGKITIEYYAPLTLKVKQPSDIDVCRNILDFVTIDLTEAEVSMFEKTDRQHYTVEYYLDKNDLNSKINDPQKYEIEKVTQGDVVYSKVIDVQTGCNTWFVFQLKPIVGSMPEKREDVIVCDKYVFPELLDNQYYYSLSGAKGIQYKEGDTLENGIYTIYLLQDNGGGCYEEVSFIVEVTPKEKVHIIPDQLLSCELFELPVLPSTHQYFIEEGNKRIPVKAGMVIAQSNTRIVVTITSDNGVCMDEYDFVVRYEECPIPKGFSPNEDGVNDRFDLSQHGVTAIKVFNRNGNEVYSFVGNYTNQWTGMSKNGKPLPSGTYYYIIQSFEQTRTGWVVIER